MVAILRERESTLIYKNKMRTCQKESACRSTPLQVLGYPCNLASSRPNSRCSAFDKRAASPSSKARTLSRAAAK
jgi:hypothetical protein